MWKWIKTQFYLETWVLVGIKAIRQVVCKNRSIRSGYYSTFNSVKEIPFLLYLVVIPRMFPSESFRKVTS